MVEPLQIRSMNPVTSLSKSFSFLSERLKMLAVAAMSEDSLSCLRFVLVSSKVFLPCFDQREFALRWKVPAVLLAFAAINAGNMVARTLDPMSNTFPTKLQGALKPKGLSAN